jgi:tetratricopeptide (TPR) repeat protein
VCWRRILKTAIDDRDQKKSKALLGEIEFLQRNYTKAEQLLREAIATDSARYFADEAFLPLGYLYCQYNRFENALGVADKALADHSYYPNYNLMAWVLIAGDIDIERGVHFAKLAIESKSEYYTFRLDRSLYEALPEHSLGLAYLKKGQVEKAIEYLEQTVKLAPNRQTFKNDLEFARKKLEGVQ